MAAVASSKCISSVLVLLLSVNIVYSLGTPGSDSFKSILTSSDNGLEDQNSFDFGKEFFVDEILEEMQRMGLRPRLGDKNTKLPCYGSTCGDTSSDKTSPNKTLPASDDKEMNVVEFNLDYSDDVADSSHSVQTRSADVSDILSTGPVKGQREARLFYNFDRGSAFNTSVAFTIPLFSFTLPGEYTLMSIYFMETIGT